MTFSKTDFRQFFNEIQMIKKRKEFSGTFKENLKGFGLVKPENAFEVKRIEYDHMYTHLFRLYGIVPNDLYADLDRFWKNAIESTKDLTAPILGTGHPLLYSGIQYSAFWGKYVEDTIEHAKKIGKRNLKDGGKHAEDTIEHAEKIGKRNLKDG